MGASVRGRFHQRGGEGKGGWGLLAGPKVGISKIVRRRLPREVLQRSAALLNLRAFYANPGERTME